MQICISKYIYLLDLIQKRKGWRLIINFFLESLNLKWKLLKPFNFLFICDFIDNFGTKIFKFQTLYRYCEKFYTSGIIISFHKYGYNICYISNNFLFQYIFTIFNIIEIIIMVSKLWFSTSNVSNANNILNALRQHPNSQLNHHFVERLNLELLLI